MYYDDLYGTALHLIDLGIKKYGSAKNLAELIDTKPANISRWKTKQRSPKLEEIAPLFKLLGSELKTISMVSENAPIEIATGGTEEIKIYEIAGGGGAWSLDSKDPVIKVYVPISYFKKAEFAFLVEGDSMHPTIKNGAAIGINTTLPFHPNEIYALRLHEGIVVKRVSVNQMNNTYIIRSDNTDKNYYPDYEVPIVEHENIFIGRVVWVMQNL